MNTTPKPPAHLSARVDQLGAEARHLRVLLGPLADWFRQAEELMDEVQRTGLWNDDEGDMDDDKVEALGMTEINDLYCDLVDGIRLSHNAH